QEIINKTELCIVSTTLNDFDIAISNLRKSVASYRSSAQVYEKEIQELNAKFATNYPTEIEKLNLSIQNIRAQSDKINLIIASLDKASHKFKTAVKGIDKIYSCDPKWDSIIQLKKDIAEASKELTAIEKKTQEIIESNQSVVLSLK
ncbi:MAG: hypothetical protein ACKO8Q_05270, partial [Bacteroidota bacterium]